MQEATPAETASASPDTRGPTAARARRARRERTRRRLEGDPARHVRATRRRLQVLHALACTGGFVLVCPDAGGWACGWEGLALRLGWVAGEEGEVEK